MTISIQGDYAKTEGTDNQPAIWPLDVIPEVLQMNFMYPNRIQISGIRFFNGERNIGLVYGGVR